MDRDVHQLASWIKWGLSQGLLQPLGVHYGMKNETFPSTKSLTMSQELQKAMKT